MLVAEQYQAVAAADAAARPLRIAIISKADAAGGGASRVAQELTTLLRARGHDATHWASWWRQPRDDLQAAYGAWVRSLHKWMKRLGLPEAVPAELPELFRRGVHRCDIVHFHDISSAFSPLTVLALGRLVPTVWTIHDCSPFTGGCLYPMECTRYQTGCGRCPQLGAWPLDTGRDFTSLLHRLKRLTAERGRITYVTPSAWAASTAISSRLFREPPRVLPNGVDVDVFHPGDREALRRRFQIPVDRPTLLLSSGNVMDKRKGVHLALAALRRHAPTKWFLVVVGAFDDDTREALAGFDYWATGYVSDTRRLAEIYAAADVFLFCSLADNMPLVVLETMACGVPTVGFATGGVPEMVEHGVSGYLVPCGDVGALATALARAADLEDVRRWGRAARERAVVNFSHASFVDRHIELYRSLLGEW